MPSETPSATVPVNTDLEVKLASIGGETEAPKPPKLFISYAWGGPCQ